MVFAAVSRMLGEDVARRMRRLVSFVCTAVFLLWCSGPGFAQPQPRDAHDSARNLLAAMRLWGDIKFFDPDVGGDKTDWDAAFMKAEPAIMAATTPEAYAAAIAALLAPLHDPATHVDDAAGSAGGRVSVVKLGDAALITIPPDTANAEAQISADVSAAVDSAVTSGVVAVDLRGVTESRAGDAAALDALFAADSPFVALLSGSLVLPRERSRSYLGYPNQNAGYQGYSAFDSVTQGATVAGTSKVKHRFVFLVDAATSLPSMALALADAGDATIYTAGGGSPAILAPSTADMQMPDGVVATYRTGDLADVDVPLTLPSANTPQDAIAQSFAAQNFAGSAGRRQQPSSGENGYQDATFPAEPMRMLAVARIYNVIRYFSPYVDLMHDDWDAAALQGIADEAAATGSRSYLLALMKLYAHLHDSHGCCIVGAAVTAEFGAGVPFESRFLHGRAVVTHLAIGDTRPSGLQPGDVVDAVDGVPTRQAMTAIERYICASTPQAADYAALRPFSQPSVFSGKKGTPIVVYFHDGHGKRNIVTFHRDVFAFPADRSGSKYFVLPGNVGYVDLDRLDTSEVDGMFDALENTRAIVFDNRGYPRGAAWPIAPRLTNAAGVRAALFATPLVASPLDVQLSDARMLPVRREFYQLLPATTGRRYLKPTVMLIDERSISQSEHSALFFRAAAHTRFVGSPTNGADGDVTSMIVPGGITLSFSGEGVRYPDGKQLQRVGIVPDVRVVPNATDIAAGNDVVLQAGLAEALRLAGSTAASRKAALKDEIARERRATLVAPSLQPPPVRGRDARALSLPWQAKGSAYSGSATAAAGYRGSDEITLASSGAAYAGGFGSFSAPLDIDEYRGKTIRIRGYLSAENVAGGVGFWLRIDGPERQFDNMQDRWLSGTSGWKPFAIVLHVPASATKAFCGLLLVGTGAAHASGLTIDVVPDATQSTGE